MHATNSTSVTAANKTVRMRVTGRRDLVGEPYHMGAKPTVRLRPSPGNRFNFSIDAVDRRAWSRTTNHLKSEISRIVRAHEPSRQPAVGHTLRELELTSRDADDGELPAV